ncbi:hypothetical protein BTVI_89735 [Pitangus sulphuratus]|nr:hypothetical protein BTVI_89735 [Pitangus sulphuratus]
MPPKQSRPGVKSVPSSDIFNADLKHFHLPLLGQIPCERQMENAHGCRMLTKALLNPVLGGTGSYSTPIHQGYTQLYCSDPHFLFSHLRSQSLRLKFALEFQPVRNSSNALAICQPQHIAMAVIKMFPGTAE